MALQAAQGMCYLHAQDLGIIHRDLKSHNLLVGDSFEVKVADFGLTVVRNKVADTISSTASVAKNGEGTEAEDKEEGAFYGIRGTPQWMAPEVMEGQRYNEKVDVYSFGIVLTEIFTRQMPFADSYKGFDVSLGVSQPAPNQYCDLHKETQTSPSSLSLSMPFLKKAAFRRYQCGSERRGSLGLMTHSMIHLLGSPRSFEH